MSIGGPARSGDDLILLYTGGTTGQPKGVMWPQDTLFRMLEELNGRDVAARALDRPATAIALPAPPLMHGTALFALPVLGQGRCVVTTADHRFDAESLLDVVVAEGIKGLCIVGDAFRQTHRRGSGPQPRAMGPERRASSSSGVVLSPSVKERLLTHLPERPSSTASAVPRPEASPARCRPPRAPPAGRSRWGDGPG